MNPPPEPSWLGLALSAIPLLCVMAVLALRRLGEVRSLAVSAVRMAIQLTLLGIVLRWVFDQRGPWIVAGVGLVMLATSAHTIGTRQHGSGWALRLEGFVTLATGVLIVMATAIALSLNLQPWYAPRIVIPLLGMVLGNSVNAVTLAVERLESDLRAERDQIELRLALGATSRQAAQPALRAATRAALTPVINGMMIAGIVAIPGMTTGQILAGADVGVAVRYQILVYLGIAGTVGICTLLLLEVRLRHYFTPADQLRHGRIDGSAT